MKSLLDISCTSSCLQSSSFSSCHSWIYLVKTQCVVMKLNRASGLKSRDDNCQILFSSLSSKTTKHCNIGQKAPSSTNNEDAKFVSVIVLYNYIAFSMIRWCSFFNDFFNDYYKYISRKPLHFLQTGITGDLSKLFSETHWQMSFYLDFCTYFETYGPVASIFSSKYFCRRNSSPKEFPVRQYGSKNSQINGPSNLVLDDVIADTNI